MLMGAGPSPERTAPRWTARQPMLLAGLPSPSWRLDWPDESSFRLDWFHEHLKHVYNVRNFHCSSHNTLYVIHFVHDCVYCTVLCVYTLCVSLLSFSPSLCPRLPFPAIFIFCLPLPLPPPPSPSPYFLCSFPLSLSLFPPPPLSRYLTPLAWLTLSLSTLIRMAQGPSPMPNSMTL